MTGKIAISCILALLACGHSDDAPAPIVCKSNAAHQNPSFFASAPNSQTLAIDSANLYLIDDDGLEKIPLAGGAKTTLVPGTIDSYSITTDATNVYWADYENSAIDAVPITGGPVTTVVTDSGSAFSLIVSRTNIYWVAETKTVPYGIASASLPSGPPTILYSASSPIDILNTSVADAENIYWIEWGATSGSIVKMPLAGGAASVVSSSSEVSGLAIVGSEIFWNGFGSILKAPLVGGAATTVVSGLATGSFLETDRSGNLYFEGKVNDGYGLFRASQSGDCVQTMITIDQSHIAAFVVGADKLYWIDQSAGLVYAAPL